MKTSTTTQINHPWRPLESGSTYPWLILLSIIHLSIYHLSIYISIHPSLMKPFELGHLYLQLEVFWYKALLSDVVFMSLFFAQGKRPDIYWCFCIICSMFCKLTTLLNNSLLELQKVQILNISILCLYSRIASTFCLPGKFLLCIKTYYSKQHLFRRYLHFTKYLPGRQGPGIWDEHELIVTFERPFFLQW
jgi:hypothetical protein